MWGTEFSRRIGDGQRAQISEMRAWTLSGYKQRNRFTNHSQPGGKWFTLWNYSQCEYTFLFVQKNLSEFCDTCYGWSIIICNFTRLPDSASLFTAEIWATTKASEQIKHSVASKYIILEIYFRFCKLYNIWNSKIYLFVCLFVCLFVSSSTGRCILKKRCSRII